MGGTLWLCKLSWECNERQSHEVTADRGSGARRPEFPPWLHHVSFFFFFLSFFVAVWPWASSVTFLCCSFLNVLLPGLRELKLWSMYAGPWLLLPSKHHQVWAVTVIQSEHFTESGWEYISLFIFIFWKVSWTLSLLLEVVKGVKVSQVVPKCKIKVKWSCISPSII